MVKDETPTSGEMQPVPLHHAEALTLQGNTAQILLDGQVYTLRITRARKLILTK
ncbi:hemin uptake protein HemP [Roseinatronobacter ekhonensis]|nr:hemin uptake protein HemP [Roseibaca ekhonensis]